MRLCGPALWDFNYPYCANVFVAVRSLAGLVIGPCSDAARSLRLRCRLPKNHPRALSSATLADPHLGCAKIRKCLVSLGSGCIFTLEEQTMLPRARDEARKGRGRCADFLIPLSC